MELRKLNEVEQRISDDLQWAWDSPEVKKYPGQYIVVHNKRIVSVGTDPQALINQAAEMEQCTRDDLVVVVGPPSGLNSEIPH